MQDYIHYIYNFIESCGAAILTFIIRDIIKYLKIPKKHRKEKKELKKLKKLITKHEKINEKITTTNTQFKPCNKCWIEPHIHRNEKN